MTKKNYTQHPSFIEIINLSSSKEHMNSLKSKKPYPQRLHLQKLIAQLTKSYPLDAIRCAVILLWAAMNRINLNSLEQGETTGQFISQAKCDEAQKVLCILKSKLQLLSIKDVEYLFESMMDAERRKTQGVVYTPNKIIDYLVRNALIMSQSSEKKLPNICDPACGSAGFLIRAAEILKSEHNISTEQAFAECLVGFDNDEWAIKHAKCLIELYLASKNIKLRNVALKLYVQDSLLTPPDELWGISGCEQGFTVVATNPPFVKLQNMETEYRAKLLRHYSDLASGSFSLAVLFLLAGHRMLRAGGCLAMITQNNLFTSLAGVEIRRYLQDHKCIKRIIDFGHQKIFENASAYTCLVFLGTEKQESFSYESLSKGINDIDLEQSVFSTIRFDSLNHKKWRLAKGSHVDKLKYIESIGHPLGSIASIKVGFATLKDSVFLVQDKGSYCVTNGGNKEAFQIERDITLPAVKIADLSNYEDLTNNKRRIIFPYYKYQGKYRLIEEKELRSKYPLAYKYLISCKDILSTRDKGKRIYEGWYAWGRTQGREAPGPKLLTKTFSKSPQFFLDKSDQLFCNGYAVFARQNSLFNHGYSIEVLNRILNSKVMHYYLKLTSFQIEGDYQCYQKNFIERFGIVDMSDAQAQTLLRLRDDEIDDYIISLYGLTNFEVDEVLG